MDKELERFEESFRDWAARPPGKTGFEAAQEVKSAIGRKSTKTVLRWSGLAAAAAIVLAVSTGVLRMHDAPPAVVGLVGEVPATGLEDGVVLMWLDEETPLYMTFQNQEGYPSGQGASP